jgi:hypothetical protein
MLVLIVDWVWYNKYVILTTLVVLVLMTVGVWRFLSRKASDSQLVVQLKEGVLAVDRVHPLDLDPDFVARFEDGAPEVRCLFYFLRLLSLPYPVRVSTTVELSL